MESYSFVFVLLLALTETIALHIVISPDEASKIMKRDDEFSRGLAGFIERTAKGSNHMDATKRGKVDKLKSMIREALNEVESKTDDSSEKDAKRAKDAPPALPLDVVTKKDIRELKTMVNSLLDEESLRAKRQGWVHYGKKKDVGDRKRQLEKEVKEMEDSQEKLEQIYEKVKRLVSAVKRSKVKDTSTGSNKGKVFISDSGDVGGKMLAKVKEMIAEKKSSDHRKNEKEIINKLKSLTKKLEAKTDHYSDIGELSLNAIRGLISKAEKRESSAEVRSHPRASDKISLDALTEEVDGLLRKLKPKSGRDGERKSDEGILTDVAVESEERSVKDGPHNAHAKTRKELIANLIRTYDALTKGSDVKSDAVEEELETLSSKTAKRSTNSGKVSKETAEAIKGFDIGEAGKRNIPHPK